MNPIGIEIGGHMTVVRFWGSTEIGRGALQLALSTKVFREPSFSPKVYILTGTYRKTSI